MRQFISEERLHGDNGGTWLQLRIFNECAHCLFQMKQSVCLRVHGDIYKLLVLIQLTLQNPKTLPINFPDSQMIYLDHF